MTCSTNSLFQILATASFDGPSRKDKIGERPLKRCQECMQGDPGQHSPALAAHVSTLLSRRGGTV